MHRVPWDDLLLCGEEVGGRRVTVLLLLVLLLFGWRVQRLGACGAHITTTTTTTTAHWSHAHTVLLLVWHAVLLVLEVRRIHAIGLPAHVVVRRL